VQLQLAPPPLPHLSPSLSLSLSLSLSVAVIVAQPFQGTDGRDDRRNFHGREIAQAVREQTTGESAITNSIVNSIVVKPDANGHEALNPDRWGLLSFDRRPKSSRSSARQEEAAGFATANRYSSGGRGRIARWLRMCMYGFNQARAARNINICAYLNFSLTLQPRLHTNRRARDRACALRGAIRVCVLLKKMALTREQPAERAGGIMHRVISITPLLIITLN